MIINKLSLALILVFSLAASGCLRAGTTSSEIAPGPIFVSDNPESIYAADPNDSWNRIFRALFTRTVSARVSDAFSGGARFVRFGALGLGPIPIRISKEKISRIELGDRAIEPLYPTFFTAEGPLQALSEPRFSELTVALRQAIDETKPRSPVERALMQSDVWAAYDVIYHTRVDALKRSGDLPERRMKLLNLLREFIRKLALSSAEINSLKNNYLTAVSGGRLPNPFSRESGWLEIELVDRRLHDEAASFRRATRVFVKPRAAPSDPGAFVESLKQFQHLDQVEGVALIIQNLLIDTSGHVVASPLFNDAQFRFFKIDPKTGAISGEPQQFELSRRMLLTDPMSGGLVEFTATAPAYLSTAGNDYDFATPAQEAGAPVVVPLRTRCTQCHDSSLTTLMTYSFHDIPPLPTARILKDHERALYVARRKEQREDFKSLSATP